VPLAMVQQFDEGVLGKVCRLLTAAELVT